jgi:hypothetical protein
MRSVSRVVAVLSVFLLLVSATLCAQTATTSLHGTVYDPKGAVIAGASVTISNSATGFTRTTKSDAQGGYQFLELPPARYDVTANAAGFSAMKQIGVELLVATPGTLNMNMQVTGGTVTVEVAGAAPMVNTLDASLGHAFGAEQIANLPFEGRDPTGILSLQPGVVFTGNSTSIDSSSDSRSGSVNGARSDQTNVVLDGVDNNDQLLGTAFKGAIRVPLDALEEFKVTTSNSDADTGRSSGGQVSLVTKSGTNHVHGGFFILNRPNFTPANDWFNKAAELEASQSNSPAFLLRNTFGANVGGPIVKDRLFFFADYEGQRQREDLQVTRVVPSALLRSGGIAYPCAQDPTCPSSGINTLTASQVASMDPNCSTPVGGFPNGTCPLGPGSNPLLAYIPGNPNSSPNSLFNLYPLPNTDTVGDGLDFRGFTFPSPLPANENAFVAKIDYNLTKDGNHRLFVRGVMNNDRLAIATAPGGNTNAATGSGGEQFPGQTQMQISRANNKGFTAGYTATLSATLINNFRFGYVSQLINDAGTETQPYIDFRGLDNLTSQTPTVNTHVPVKNIVDDVTKVIGNHSLQLGANYRMVDNLRNSNEENFFYGQTNVYWTNNSGISNTGSSLDPAAFGFPAVNSNFAASYDFAMAAMAGLVTEVVSNYEQTKSLQVIPQGELVPRHFRDNELEFYGQDQWRIKPNLTFTYGLRYSLLQPPFETNGLQSAPTISLHDWYVQRGQNALNGQAYEPPISFGLSGPANGKAPYWAWDYNNFAPRIAVAYSPKADSGFWRTLWGGEGKTSIRAGYGIYYDHFGEGVTNTFDRNGSFGLTTSISNVSGVQTVDGSARYSGLYTIPTQSASTTGLCPNSPCPIVEPPPAPPFPVTPPAGPAAGGYAIAWGLDDKLKTPYSHVIDFSITRQLPSNFVVEASYIGRFAHRLLQEEDMAEPVNLRDTTGGQTYFQAAQALARQYDAGTDISQITPALVGSYWQNLFPAAAGPARNVLLESPNKQGLIQPCSGSPIPAIRQLSATQAMYDLYCNYAGNETTALELADVPGVINATTCFPACATLNGALTNGYDYYDSQYSSLFAWRSIGNSSYNAAQFSLRHQTGGLTFDLNYTYSKSLDMGSNAERISEFEGFGLGSQIINSWFPNQNRAVSDFDTTHIINANWVYELPFGRGKKFAGNAGRLANAVVGGWTVSGLWRWSTGYPFSLYSPEWSTNFQLQSPGIPISSARPKTGSFIVNEPAGGTGPNVFQDPGITDAATNPNAAINLFRSAYPGEVAFRNGLRGPGTFNIDTNLLKNWSIREGQLLTFNWSVYNMTNSPRFDVGTMSVNGNTSLSSVSSFGNFSSTLSNPRVMEFGLRYSF